MISRYMRWLHTRWARGHGGAPPDGARRRVHERAGVCIVGDLTGIPLLKFAADSGARAVRAILNDPSFVRRDTSRADVLDVAIVGGSVSGFAAALELKKHRLRFEVFEASEPFSTIVNFPRGKPFSPIRRT